MTETTTITTAAATTATIINKEENSVETKSQNDSSLTPELSKTERRRLAKQRKKERIMKEREEKQKQGGGSASSKRGNKKPKITKAERKEKYTLKAIERRNAKTIKKREKNMICFQCRKKGHSAIHCPENNSNEAGGTCIPVEGKICYKCGSTEHRLADCPKRKQKRKRKVGGYEDEELPYATCFVCGEMGHLALQCEKNQKGVFVLGGSCRECGGKDHIAADCPVRIKKAKENTDDDVECNLISLDEGAHGDDDPGFIFEKVENKVDLKEKKKRKVVHF